MRTLDKVLTALIGKWWKRFVLDLALVAANVWAALYLHPDTTSRLDWPTWVMVAAIGSIMAADGLITYRRWRGAQRV